MANPETLEVKWGEFGTIKLRKIAWSTDEEPCIEESIMEGVDDEDEPEKEAPEELVEVNVVEKEERLRPVSIWRGQDEQLFNIRSREEQ